MNNKIPNNLPLDKDSRTAILVSMIIDEGCITENSIEICQKSRNLLRFIREQAMELLGEETISKVKKVKIRYKGKSKVYYKFSILSSGILPFYKHVKLLISKYGTMMDLGDKMKKFMKLVKKYRKRLREANLVKATTIKLTPSLIEIMKLIRAGFSKSKEIIEKSRLKKSMVKELLKRSRNYGLTYVRFGKNGSYIYSLTDLGKKILKN